jgi:hypothetical protein
MVGGDIVGPKEDDSKKGAGLFQDYVYSLFAGSTYTAQWMYSTVLPHCHFQYLARTQTGLGNNRGVSFVMKTTT